MSARFIALSLLIAAQTSFAVFPSISCEQNGRALIFEEGVDEFFLDVKDNTYPGSFLGNLLNPPKPVGRPISLPIGTPTAPGTPATPVTSTPTPALTSPPITRRPFPPGGIGGGADGLHLGQFKLTKASASRPGSQPVCRFGLDRPFLLLCNEYGRDMVAKVTNVGDGVVEELKLGYLNVTSSTLKKESLDYRGEVVTEDIVRFSVRTTVVQPAVPGTFVQPIMVNADIDFPAVTCKSGELKESPSR